MRALFSLTVEAMLADPRPDLAELTDLRRETKNKLHALQDILRIVFCAVRSGVEGKEGGVVSKISLAFPTILGGLDLHGAMVRIDAMGGQKENPPPWWEDVRLWRDTEAAKGALPVQETVGKDHGRIENRRAVLSESLNWLERKPEWRGRRAVGRVESTCIEREKVATESRYSLRTVTNVERLAEVVRGHGAIEKSPHWGLDRPFGEDAHRARKDFSPENRALVRRLA